MKRQLEHVEAEAQRIQMGNGGVDGDSGGSGVLGGVPANNADNEMAITNGSANGASLPTALPAAGAPSSVPRTDLPVTDTEAAIAESDARSVYVGNVSDAESTTHADFDPVLRMLIASSDILHLLLTARNRLTMERLLKSSGHTLQTAGQ